MLSIKQVFSKQNITLLKNWGETDKDIAQMRRAYKKLRLYDEDGNRITKEQAEKVLGMEQFLSGIERASFHYDAIRNGIYFDCGKFFENINKEEK